MNKKASKLILRTALARGISYKEAKRAWRRTSPKDRGRARTILEKEESN